MVAQNVLKNIVSLVSSTSRLEIIKGGGGEVQKIKILASSACVYVIMNGPWLPKVWPSGT